MRRRDPFVDRSPDLTHKAGRTGTAKEALRGTFFLNRAHHRIDPEAPDVSTKVRAFGALPRRMSRTPGIAARIAPGGPKEHTT